MNFDDFKKIKTNSVELNEKLNKENDSNFEKDQRIWMPKIRDDKTGYAIIRFLPNKENPNDFFWIKTYEHGYEHNGRWYVEKCPTTLDKNGNIINDCPQCQDNAQYWQKDSSKADNDFARPRSRKMRYYANILVIKHPDNPEDEGKVFIYKFTKEIYTKIISKLQPKNENKEAINIHDFWNGCDFELDIFTKKYDNNKEGLSFANCEFKSPSELFNGNEDKLREVYNNMYDLEEFRDPSKFKTFEELSKRVQQVAYGAPLNKDEKENDQLSEGYIGKDNENDKPTDDNNAFLNNDTDDSFFDSNEKEEESDVDFLKKFED